LNSNFIDFKLFAVFGLDESAPLGRGGNRKGIAVVFEALEGETEPLREFLLRVFNALKLDLDEDALLLPIRPGERLNLQNLCRKYDIRFLISFGVSPNRLSMHVNEVKYHPFRLNERTFIFADDLSRIKEERDKGGKRMSGMLWEALQAMFSS
jgi:hypothetical protein